MKTKEELQALKNEVDTLNKKLAELTEDELKQVSGGFIGHFLMGFAEDTVNTKDCYVSAIDTKEIKPALCANNGIRCASYERCCNPGKVYNE